MPRNILELFHIRILTRRLLQVSGDVLRLTPDFSTVLGGLLHAFCGQRGWRLVQTPFPKRFTVRIVAFAWKTPWHPSSLPSYELAQGFLIFVLFCLAFNNPSTPTMSLLIPFNHELSSEGTRGDFRVIITIFR